MPENVKGGTFWDLLTYIQLQNIEKFEGDPFETLKKFVKRTYIAEKNERGDPLVSSGFVGYL